jgi:hypothetical protein
MGLDQRKPIEIVRDTVSDFEQTRADIERYTNSFIASLFSAIEEFVQELIDLGVSGLKAPKRATLPTGKQALQLEMLGYKIIFVPLTGVAWPNPRDEARVPGAKFKEPCGRIAVFLSEDPARESFYDFLIWGDGSWFAWGYGWPKQDDEYEKTNFKALATELVSSFAKDIHRTWKPRDETTLGDATAAGITRRVYTFGLPGDE